jgi:Transposase
MTVTIGIDPHKATHTAVAIDGDEAELASITIRATRRQTHQLLRWAEPVEQRTWAIESAGGLGYLLAQQLADAGEHVLDVPATLASRVRVLGTGKLPGAEEWRKGRSPLDPAPGGSEEYRITMVSQYQVSGSPWPFPIVSRYTRDWVERKEVHRDGGSRSAHQRPRRGGLHSRDRSPVDRVSRDHRGGSIRQVRGVRSVRTSFGLIATPRLSAVPPSTAASSHDDRPPCPRDTPRQTDSQFTGRSLISGASDEHVAKDSRSGAVEILGRGQQGDTSIICALPQLLSCTLGGTAG